MFHRSFFQKLCIEPSQLHHIVAPGLATDGQAAFTCMASEAIRRASPELAQATPMRPPLGHERPISLEGSSEAPELHRTWVAKLLDLRLPLLAIGFVGIGVVQLATGSWVGDFWQHAAVVREIAEHPLRPSHPQLALDAPHAFAGPYLVALGWLARLTGASPIGLLGFMGILNLGVLAAGVWRLVARLDARVASTATFYVLLLVLFWWGSRPWNFSGFLHFAVLPLVGPYPSTAAFAASLHLMASMAPPANPMRTIAGSAGVGALSGLIVLSHPLTGPLLAVGIVAVLLQSPTRPRPSRLGVACIMVIALIVSWPYYPVVTLIFHEGGGFDAANAPLYRDVLSRIWPSLIGVVPLLLMVRRRAATLPLLVSGLAAIYLVGLFTGHLSLGRSIAGLVFALHLSIGLSLAQVEAGLRGSILRRICFSLGAVLIILTPTGPRLLRAWAGGLGTPSSSPASELQEITSSLPSGSIILAPLTTGAPLPALGYKILASHQAMAFVPDHDERQAAVRDFFEPGTAPGRRAAILDQFRVEYVIARRQFVDSATSGQLATRLQRARESFRFVLLVVRGPRFPSGGEALSESLP